MFLLNNIILFSVFIANKFNYYTKILNNKKNQKNDYINPIRDIENLDIKNNIDFLLNRKTKIFIHVEQLIPYTNIYHIGVSFKKIFKTIRYDLRWIDIPILHDTITKSYYFFWDYSNYNIDEIMKYEKNLKFNYILGIYDCRHYVRNLTYWSCNNPTPVWKLRNYINKKN